MEQQGHEEQLDTIRCELEEFLSRARFIPEDRQEAVVFADSLEKYIRSAKQATIPLVITPVKFEENRTLDYHTMRRVKTKLEQFPPIEGEPLIDNSGGKYGVVLAAATRLCVLPRLSNDNYIYRSHSAEYSTGMEESYVRAIYNCFELKGSNLPKHTYWHETFAGDAFTSYINAVVITVNKPFSPTNTLLSRLRQRLTNRNR